MHYYCVENLFIGNIFGNCVFTRRKIIVWDTLYLTSWKVNKGLATFQLGGETVSKIALKILEIYLQSV